MISYFHLSTHNYFNARKNIWYLLNHTNQLVIFNLNQLKTTSCIFFAISFLLTFKRKISWTLEQPSWYDQIKFESPFKDLLWYSMFLTCNFVIFMHSSFLLLFAQSGLIVLRSKCGFIFSCIIYLKQWFESSEKHRHIQSKEIKSTE